MATAVASGCMGSMVMIFFATSIVTGCNGVDAGVSLENQTLHDQWSAKLSSAAIFSSPCAVGNNSAIIGCHDGKLRKFSLQNGAVVWECNIGVAIFAC